MMGLQMNANLVVTMSESELREWIAQQILHAVDQEPLIDEARELADEIIAAVRASSPSPQPQP